MRILKPLLLSLGVYIFSALIILMVSFFLNLRANQIFAVIVGVIGVGCMVLGIKDFIKKKYRVFDLCMLGIIILCNLRFAESINMKILKASSGTVSVYSMVKNKMETNKKERDYTSVFKTSQYENITLLYHPDLEPAVKLINTYLKHADEDTDKLFLNIEQKPLTIRFDYDEKVFRNLTPDRVDLEGFYSREKNKINILAEDCYSDVLSLSLRSSDFKDTVLHEYSHYKLEEYVEQNNLQLDKIPAWFDEGLASYIAYEGARQPNDIKKLIQLSELTNPKDWIRYSNETEGAIYDQAHYTVSQLILSKGNKVIQEILLKTKDLSFEAAFKEVMGLSLEDYEKELEADMKNGWKKYRKMIPVNYPKDIRSIKIEGLEEYVKANPNNIEALFDLETVYSGSGDYEKAKQKLNIAVEKYPENSLAWRRLAIVLENMNDFEGALKSYEKEISVTKENYDSYMSMAQVLLLSDTEKAVQMAEKGIQYNKTKYFAKQEQEVKVFINAVKNNKPYEGCLRLMKSNTVNSTALKKALRQKIIKDYPNVKNASRTELEKMKF